MQLGVNHIGHFLFTKLLLDKIKVRVLNLNSVFKTLEYLKFYF